VIKGALKMGAKVIAQISAWPSGYQLGGLGAVLLALAIVGGYWIFAEAEVAKLRQKAASAAALEQGWTPHAIQGEFFAEQQTTAIKAKSGIIYAQRIRLKQGDKTVGEFTIVKIYEGAHWNGGRADDLYMNGRKVDLLAELRTPRFKDLFSQAKQVLCIGLASHDGVEIKNAALSLERAQRLRDLVASSGTIPRDAQVIAIPFGSAMDGHAKNDLAAEEAQRPAVVIGISQYDSWINLPTLYDELLKRSQLNTIDLSRYTGAGTLKDAVEKIPQSG
jgi:hypothetical protein